MLSKVEKDNKILMQLINHHKKSAEAAKNMVSTDAQMLNTIPGEYSWWSATLIISCACGAAYEASTPG
jgi:hypothetical protein